MRSSLPFFRVGENSSSVCAIRRKVVGGGRRDADGGKPRPYGPHLRRSEAVQADGGKPRPYGPHLRRSEAAQVSVGRV
jgi:hypothetical protein